MNSHYHILHIFPHLKLSFSSLSGYWFKCHVQEASEAPDEMQLFQELVANLNNQISGFQVN